MYNNQEQECMDLPPGFRFHPTDEEIITHYLSQKVINRNFTARAIGEVDLNKCEPWDLPTRAKMGEKEWWFFCQRDRKYPTGTRTNRATESGYWKATGKDKEIFRGRNLLVGMKKTLVFYLGRAPRGEKTNWVIHEYRLEGKLTFSNLPKSIKYEWVVSRVFHKNVAGAKKPMSPGLQRIDSFVNNLLDTTSLPALVDPPVLYNTAPALSNPEFATPAPLVIDPQTAQPCSYFAYPGPAHLGPVDPCYNFNHEEAIRRHCKAEQYSNQSVLSPSHETGLSTDKNPEISSVISRGYDEFSETEEPVMDYDNIWTF